MILNLDLFLNSWARCLVLDGVYLDFLGYFLSGLRGATNLQSYP